MKIFYNPLQSCAEANGYSPSASKPALFVADTLQHFPSVQVIKSRPANLLNFARAHSAGFVQDILDCRADNGFGNRSPAIAATLPFTTGSFMSAARHAMKANEHVCSPASGFHHAGFKEVDGFCTFNGLMVAAADIANIYEGAVGILDIDAHYGNGTDDIIQRKKITYVKHHTFGKHFHDAYDCRQGAFERWLEKSIADLQDCSIILYQAGADPHLNDPLGGCLTTKQMYQRDLAVFKAFKGKALVWNLAGGYQRDAAGTIEPVLALHRNTVKAWYEVHA